MSICVNPMLGRSSFVEVTMHSAHFHSGLCGFGHARCVLRSGSESIRSFACASSNSMHASLSPCSEPLSMGNVSVNLVLLACVIRTCPRACWYILRIRHCVLLEAPASASAVKISFCDMEVNADL